jgi:hypothetical protein
VEDVNTKSQGSFQTPPVGRVELTSDPITIPQASQSDQRQCAGVPRVALLYGDVSDFRRYARDSRAAARPMGLWGSGEITRLHSSRKTRSISN